MELLTQSLGLLARPGYQEKDVLIRALLHGHSD
ncbi:hypothetical protein FX983_05099 [Pseudomonas frederiksbergensis]|uniref:Uncharacterized protein n=1 Tax=Pseudomonas frederiksbergensis TaxID=104087 RepID=A0A6L5BT23_9PSED|nr:hypothetical protein FX983_05099 [Pseudomonas frederiksbergensis]